MSGALAPQTRLFRCQAIQQLVPLRGPRVVRAIAMDPRSVAASFQDNGHLLRRSLPHQRLQEAVLHEAEVEFRQAVMAFGDKQPLQDRAVQGVVLPLVHCHDEPHDQILVK